MTTNNDFISALYQIAEERGLGQEAVLDQIKKAYLTAYKKMVKEEATDEEMQSMDVDIDLETGEIYVLADKKVVSVITDQKTQILESQAKLIDPRLREGDHIQIDVTPENFGRIAAQAALQRLMQGLKDAEHDTMIAKYQDKVGKIVSGIIQRKDPNYVRVEVDRAEAILPNSEQIPGEFYRSSDRKRFLLERLSNTATDKRMVLSRASNDFLKALFEVEVPEVATGSVEVMNIAREAGSRSKVAVTSKHEKVDAIGSCVGPRGTRIDSIMNEINPEKVDIILWDGDIRNYIINALSPAKVADISVDTKETYAKVLVNDDMLSLAIGKDGQNVRLAAKLTGYKIDITSDKDLFDKEGKISESKEAAEGEVESFDASPDIEELESEQYGHADPEVDAAPETLDVLSGTSAVSSDSMEVVEDLNIPDNEKNLIKNGNDMTLEQIKEDIEDQNDTDTAKAPKKTRKSTKKTEE